MVKEMKLTHENYNYSESIRIAIKSKTLRNISKFQINKWFSFNQPQNLLSSINLKWKLKEVHQKHMHARSCIWPASRYLYSCMPYLAYRTTIIVIVKHIVCFHLVAPIVGINWSAFFVWGIPRLSLKVFETVNYMQYAVEKLTMSCHKLSW